MLNYLFEWEQNKANANFKKHKVRFEMATSIFRDPRALTIFDNEHSNVEDRWITIGLAQNSHLLLVVHTYIVFSADNVIIRIISARKATKNETKVYRGDL